MKILWAVFASLPLVYAVSQPAQNGSPKPDDKVVFGRDIQPIFKAHCINCHSGASAAAGLDLIDGSKLKGADVLKFDGTGYELLRRVKGEGGKQRMPIGFVPLQDSDIELIHTWLKTGASFGEGEARTHWSYVPVGKVSVPALQDAWIRNPIDAFVLKTLDEKKLRPSPPAERSILVRRMYLDVIGLPPTPEELKQALKDSKAGWDGRLLDKLLAKPQYGEHMAQQWLDLARYADSNGYEKDRNRSAWLYRDWVINAFNSNQPFDKFTIDQLAGDLKPNSSIADRIATGFQRNTMLNEEGGVDQAEAHYNVILDRVGTVGTVWLGSTIQCARCHDHKYDPFSQADFFKMFATFDNVKVVPTGPKEVGEEKWPEPYMPVPSAEQAKELRQLQQLIKSLQARIDQAKASKKDDQAFQAWMARQDANPRLVYSGVSKTASGATFEVKDNVFLAKGAVPSKDTYTIGFAAPTEELKGLVLDVLPHPELNAGGPGRGNGNFVLTDLKVVSGGAPVEVKSYSADFSQDQFPASAIFQSDDNQGWAISPSLAKEHRLVVELAHPLKTGEPIELTLAFQSGYDQHVLGSFAVEGLRRSDDFAQSKYSASMRKALDPKLARNVFDREFSPSKEDYSHLASSMAKMATINSQIPTAQVLVEKPGTGPLKNFIHIRGEFLQTGDEVTSGTPTVLGNPSSAPRFTRLSMAEWLVDRKNPLTARVRVNQMWEQIFGQGIVDTPEDFGTQGDLPSHPEMLDWLAEKFMESGWDQKALLKLIMTSATYQQRSASNAELNEMDPRNALLARGPRVRMPAEMIRDTILRASGLLSLKMGGPSVMPYQPDGVWNNPYGGAWMPSTGEDAHRRGVYVFIKRTSTYPSFLSFDATSREQCVARRIRTNTPLQALTMLNDPVVLEAAQSLATNMAKASPKRDEQIAYGFLACTGRTPTAQEIKVVADAWTNLEKKTGNPKRVAPLIATTLLNMDATITKE